MAYKPNPKYNGVLRPNLSNKGPYNNCPIEIPTKKEESESITLETDVFKFFAMLGKAGKYISMDKGPMEVRSPKISIKKNGDLSLDVFMLQR
jgi:hypothetical protein